MSSRIILPDMYDGFSAPCQRWSVVHSVCYVALILITMYYHLQGNITKVTYIHISASSRRCRRICPSVLFVMT